MARTRSAPSPTAAAPLYLHGAIIIPAHNEVGVISRTLKALGALPTTPGFEVIVVCNACTDGTSAAARAVAGVRVVELEEASKTAALNVGDSVATTWPRLYLDADVEITPEAVAQLFAALEHPDTAAARARYVYDAGGAFSAVAAYYRARSRIPAPALRLWGAGGYAVSQAGHRRFERFPAVTADDSWFDAQFADHEKRVIETTPMRVRTPRDLTGLLAVLTRQRRGQVELGIPSTAAIRVRALLGTVRGVRSAFDMTCYVLLTAVARRRAQRILRGGERPWERDASSRVVGEVQS